MIFALPIQHSLRTLRLAALLLLLAPAARATTFVWTAGDSSNAWSDALNWQNHVAPSSSLTNTDIVYNSSDFTFPNLTGGYSIHSLTFNTATNGYDFNLGSLTLGTGGIAQNSTFAETFDIAITLDAGQRRGRAQSQQWAGDGWFRPDR